MHNQKLLDDGANMSISNEIDYFLPNSLRNVPDDKKFQITGISGTPHKIEKFGILQIEVISELTQQPILIQVIAAYTPSIPTTILCRHDIITFGKLTTWNQKEELLNLSYYGLHDYISCDVIQKRKYLRIGSSGKEPVITINAIDHNLGHMVNSIAIDALTVCDIASQSRSKLPTHHAMFLHNMLGHSSFQTIKNTIETDSIKGNISKQLLDDPSVRPFCNSCNASQPGRKRTHQERQSNTATRPLQRLQMDVIPIPHEFIMNVKEFSDSPIINARMFLLLVDEYTRRSYAIPMNSTSEITDAFDTFMDEVNLDKNLRDKLGLAKNNPEDCKIQYIWSDAAPYFTGVLHEYCKTSPTVRSKNYNQIIVTNTPCEAEQQFLNGIVESRWRLIKEKIYSVMADSGYYLWAYAMSYSNNIVNFTAHTEYNELQPSPYYRMFQKPVPMANFFPFAAPTVVKLTDQQRQDGRKFNFSGIAVDFESLRNPHTIKVLCIDDPDKKLPLENSTLKVRVTQNYTMDKWNSIRNALAQKKITGHLLDTSFGNMRNIHLNNEKLAKKELDMIDLPDDVQQFRIKQTLNADKALSRNRSSDAVKTQLKKQIDEINEQIPEEMRVKYRTNGSIASFQQKIDEALLQLRDHLEKEKQMPVDSNINSSTMTEIHDETSEQTAHFTTKQDIDFSIFNFTAVNDESAIFQQIQLDDDVSSYDVSEVHASQTSKDDFQPKAKISQLPKQFVSAAIEKERQSLLDTGTIVPLTPDDKPTKENTVHSMTITKVNDDNTCKARIVALGNRQSENTHTETSYAQVNVLSLRILLHICLLRDMIPQQADVSSAFLSENLNEVLYIRFRRETYRLKKCLYGLRQAGFMFYKKLSNLLLNQGFQQCHGDDPCVYFRKEPNNFLSIIGVLTDDLLFCMESDKIQGVVNNLKMNGLKIPAINQIFKYNGLEIHYDSLNHTLEINQIVLIKQMIFDLKEKGYNVTPQNDLPEALFLNDEDTEPVQKRFYQSLVGSLNWISQMSRPDITHIVSRAATVNNKPNKNHLDILLQLYGYLEATTDKAMLYRRPKDGLPNVTVFTDSDFISRGTEENLQTGNLQQNTTSQAGIVIMMNETGIYWNSKKQPCPTNSVCAAEIVAANMAYDAVIPILSLYHTLGYPMTRAIHFIDNEAAIKAVTSERTLPVMKTLDRKYTLLKHYIDKLRTHLCYVESRNNLADYLTKSIGDVKLNKADIKKQIDTVMGHGFTSKEDFLAHIQNLFSAENLKKGGEWSNYQNITNYQDLQDRRHEDRQSAINPFW